MSEHAYANGIDIKKFIMGSMSVKVEDYRKNNIQAWFLRKAFRSACWKCSLALGPPSDRNHLTHFHLDNGAYLGLPKVRCFFR